ncbi:hypothetical protein DERP_005732 [Dermatophagoides pteronyssinus]|uniref:Uncharacterized protein n=1 Tax=Dermatophagoides pteronyssinus TaxID=6956 RepID=A0ABQ8J9E2_DERPT|nr:hypothetical protein DERP_005732 [Dermatophagoides pteronyssinus]
MFCHSVLLSSEYHCDVFIIKITIISIVLVMYNNNNNNNFHGDNFIPLQPIMIMVMTLVLMLMVESGKINQQKKQKTKKFTNFYVCIQNIPIRYDI